MFIKRTMVLLLCLARLLWCQLLLAATPAEILRKADESRGNLEGITWVVTLASEALRQIETQTYDVKARGYDILAENLAPPKDRGNKILMVNGNMWFHKPGLSKAVPISQRQRLMGNAAYGDIAATNYAEDYEATSLEEQSVNGEICYVFDLKAKDNRAAYDRIKYWISNKRVVGVKAEYFTASGKKFKSANMENANTVKIDGEVRPFISKIIIYDDLLTSNVTTLNLTKPTFRKLGRYVFDVNLLVK
jgi:outer membrane lipoprotein-sorting protein